ncbi:MAG TPA: glycerol acyltransferase [Moraxellaceae bacterium]|nr:glycerol acyltransferase [Moraxellaceae bacterium]
MPDRSFLRRLLPPDLAAKLDASPKPVGSLGYDRWGFYTSTNRNSLALTRLLYEHYFRTEAYGLENIPQKGRVLLVSNHSGFLPLDGILIGIALATNPHGSRMPRAMVERFFPSVPWVGNWLNAVGAVVGDVQNCVDMLHEDEAVIVFPEGVRGTGKGWDKRYELQRFGCGFLHLAMETDTPIIPVGVAGCEEALPMFGNASSLARSLGLPYFPVAVPIPFPAKVVISFGKPIRFKGPVINEQDTEKHVDEVKEAIRNLIDEGLIRRGSKERAVR